MGMQVGSDQDTGLLRRLQRDASGAPIMPIHIHANTSRVTQGGDSSEGSKLRVLDLGHVDLRPVSRCCLLLTLHPCYHLDQSVPPDSARCGCMCS